MKIKEKVNKGAIKTAHQIQETTEQLLNITASTPCTSRESTDILREDLALSSSESDSSLPDYSNQIHRTTIATNTDKSQLLTPKSVGTETSPQVCVNLESQDKVYMSTLGCGKLGQFKIPKRPYNTQLGALQAITTKAKKTQTDEVKVPAKKDCIQCCRQDHLINSRFAYWIKDFEENYSSNPPTKYISREDYKRLPNPLKRKPEAPPTNPQYQLKMAAFQGNLIPKAPKDTAQQKASTIPVINSPVPRPLRPQHSRDQIIIRESTTPPNTTGLRRPANVTVDAETYERICQRRVTRPSLMCMPKPLILPPPKEGAWEYTTATKQ